MPSLPPPLGRVITPLLLLAVGVLLNGCGEKPTLLEQIRAEGELRVVTRPGPTTYFHSPEGPAGIEYELASRFAERLGVELKLLSVERPARVLTLLKRRSIHLAAAGMSLSDEERAKLHSGPTYQEITQQVVYRLGKGRQPKRVEDLQGKRVEVIEECPQGDLLHEYSERFPKIQWREVNDADSGELMRRVAKGEIDYTILQSNFVDLHRLFYPELAVAPLKLAPVMRLAWAFPPGEDASLREQARLFFNELRESGELERILERYYGRTIKFDQVHTQRFLRAIERRLPPLEPLFREAAEKQGLDWRLLAAVGYQESWWKRDAVSPTGVRGIMMLTRATAKMLGVEDRVDPEQSIHGGARYLASMKRRLPDRLQEPDLTWMALAAYNVGLGHLEDARKLTQRLGGNPDAWADVKKHLPLLSKKKWYKTVKHGYARGGEPVHYVKRIRAYYQMLKWLENNPPPKEKAEEEKVATAKQ